MFWLSARREDILSSCDFFLARVAIFLADVPAFSLPHILRGFSFWNSDAPANMSVFLVPNTCMLYFTSALRENSINHNKWPKHVEFYWWPTWGWHMTAPPHPRSLLRIYTVRVRAALNHCVRILRGMFIFKPKHDVIHFLALQYAYRWMTLNIHTYMYMYSYVRCICAYMYVYMAPLLDLPKWIKVELENNSSRHAMLDVRCVCDRQSVDVLVMSCHVRITLRVRLETSPADDHLHKLGLTIVYDILKSPKPNLRKLLQRYTN